MAYILVWASPPVSSGMDLAWHDGARARVERSGTEYDRCLVSTFSLALVHEIAAKSGLRGWYCLFAFCVLGMVTLFWFYMFDCINALWWECIKNIVIQSV